MNAFTTEQFRTIRKWLQEQYKQGRVEALDEVERLMRNREHGGGEGTRLYEQPGFTTVQAILDEVRKR
jgi:hypothetical protein